MKLQCVLKPVFFAAFFTATAWAGENAVPLRPDPNTSTGWAVDLPQGPQYNPQTNPNPAWGTSSSSIRQVHAYQFVPIDSSTTYSFLSGTFRYRTGGTHPWFNASLSLPTGVRLVRFDVFGCDQNASADLYAFVIVASGTSALSHGGPISSGTPGCTFFGFDLTPYNLIVDNLNKRYALEVNLSSATSDLSFSAFNVRYQLTVSPAPATPTFGDVPAAHPFFQYVEALVASGITSGCGGGNYCPNNPVTRGQMAVFLAKALGLHWPN
ncbi:MAG: S-layer homology domain-containing protein [Thermoanaerobaculum sp.]|nr:S-layer homology domain-containing protein [Thermoanaerobaculum sp.]MDW7968069.1 S-layer homology domain-containing protein [Thermoanaerobaculum sp.]